MGKPTGFIDYQRQDVADIPADQRISCFDYIHRPLSPNARKEQAGRCMNCGVPFCSAGLAMEGQDLGCPLHNLIPEWNDQLWNDNLPLALERLLKTNCFPEFTGYVCPHPCETACSVGKAAGPVSINDNERFIIEEAFHKGLMAPCPPKHRSGKTVAVVGSGPAGLAVATLLNQRGHLVTVYERSMRPGGLLTYGIPSMKLPKEVVERRVRLLEAEGVVFRCGVDVGSKGSPATQELADNHDAVVLAVGAQEPRHVAYEGEATGICYALEYLGAAAKAQLGEASLPSSLDASGKTVAVVGAGDTANDCIATALRQGACDVLQLIRRPAGDYGPMNDYAHQETQAHFHRDIRRFGTQVSKVHANGDGELAQLTLAAPEGEVTVDAQLLIVASGFSGAQTYALAKGDNIFQAGDMVSGATLVVRALVQARQTARSVDRFLTGYSTI